MVPQRLLVVVASSAVLGGCPPALKEVRPETVVYVADPRGAPVAVVLPDGS